MVVNMILKERRSTVSRCSLQHSPVKISISILHREVIGDEHKPTSACKIVFCFFWIRV